MTEGGSDRYCSDGKVASGTRPRRIDSARLRTPSLPPAPSVKGELRPSANNFSRLSEDSAELPAEEELPSKESLRRGIFCRIYITRAAFEVYRLCLAYLIKECVLYRRVARVHQSQVSSMKKKYARVLLGRNSFACIAHKSTSTLRDTVTSFDTVFVFSRDSKLLTSYNRYRVRHVRHVVNDEKIFILCAKSFWYSSY